MALKFPAIKCFFFDTALTYYRATMSDDFDFEDVLMDSPSGEGVSTPLRPVPPHGALHASSPPFVASEATGGVGKMMECVCV